MYETCHVVGDYHKRIRKQSQTNPNQLNLFKDLDMYHGQGISFEKQEPFYVNFRSAIKKMVMNPEISVPIQILKEATIDPEDRSTQNAATKAWNFCTGIYYKSGRHPWILDKIEKGTCYLGISFYHKKGLYNDDVYTSMAHLFANDFEDIILRGKKVDFDESLGAPYLDYEKAKHLIKNGLEIFTKLRRRKPERLVIHKTSTFNEAETKGFSEILEGEDIIYDLISMRKVTMRLIRHGTMPIPRGSMISMDKENHFLYTKGYVPESFRF